MTATHLNHFGLQHTATTNDSILFSGSLGNCKRMAAAHGMEVEKCEGAILSSDCGHAIYAPVNESAPMRVLYRNGGMIQKCQSDYTLVMPLAVWMND